MDDSREIRRQHSVVLLFPFFRPFSLSAKDSSRRVADCREIRRQHSVCLLYPSFSLSLCLLKADSSRRVADCREEYGDWLGPALLFRTVRNR